MPNALRVNVALPESVVEMINTLKGWLHLTQTQVVRESIEFRFWVQQQVNDGATVVLERRAEDGSTERTAIWMPPAGAPARHDIPAPGSSVSARR